MQSMLVVQRPLKAYEFSTAMIVSREEDFRRVFR